MKPSGVAINLVSGVAKKGWQSKAKLFFRSPNAAALQGTSCGQGRHCNGGLCVKKTQGGAGDGSGSILESFSDPSGVTSTTATSVGKSSTSEPGRVLFLTKTFDICQFFAQFGIALEICQQWHNQLLTDAEKKSGKIPTRYVHFYVIGLSSYFQVQK